MPVVEIQREYEQESLRLATWEKRIAMSVIEIHREYEQE